MTLHPEPHPCSFGVMLLAAVCAAVPSRAATGDRPAPPADPEAPAVSDPEAPASTQPPGGPAPETAPVPSEPALVPPKLVGYVEAEYPVEAFEQGLTADVLAEIDIDETGAVIDVRVLESVGHGFDEAARAAMTRFVFEPAKKEGEPIPARITYRYRFFIEEKEAPAPETGPEAAPPPATLISRVLTMEDEPIIAAFVTVTPVGTAPKGAAFGGEAAVPEGELTANTDEQGLFRLSIPKAGKYRIEIVSPGYKPYETEEEVVAGEERELIYRLEIEASEYEMVVRAKRPAREVTRREVTMREINKVPGTGGDALRAVQNLPGVARAPMSGGEIPVRGSAPYDTVFFLDSLNMPMLYHFGGMTSIVNSDLLETIDFYPGNFSVKYGRATGGVIDVKTRAPKTDRFHAYIDADVWDVGVLAEGPIGEHWSVAATVRRSYIDGIMKAVNLMGDDIKLTVAPRYYDYQLVADYHPNARHNLRLFFYGTDDQWIMTWDDNGDSPFWGSGLDTHLLTHQGQAEWRFKISEQLQNQLDLGFGYWGGHYNEGVMKQDWNVYPLLIREELTFDPGKIFILRLGADMEIRWAKVKMKVPTDLTLEGEEGYWSSANDKLLTFEGTRFWTAAGLYAELELTAIPRTQVIYGVRGDYYSNLDRWGVDPRVVVRYELFPRTTLKAGFGLFNQPPMMQIADKAYGNPNLELTQAIHYSVGVEQQLLENLEIGLEGFYKDLRKVTRSSTDLVERNGELVPERYNNDAKGRVYGMEVELDHKPTQRFFGRISYTLMRSERQDEPGASWRLFDYDQTHILTALGTLTVGWGIDIGVKFRLVSGNPYTPVLDSSYDADSDQYIPLYGKTNSSRMPMFHQLDLRIDKKWQWKYMAFTAYLDVQNIYNYRPTEDYAYSYDYAQRAAIEGLPIIPSLGLKVEY